MTIINFRDLAQHAFNMAQKKGINIALAVCHREANLAYFERMEDAKMEASDLAINKAKTASLLQIPTSYLTADTVPHSFLTNAAFKESEICIEAGGMPIFNRDGEYVISLGIAGTDVAEDIEMAHELAIYLYKNCKI